MRISTPKVPELSWRTGVVALLLASLLVPLIFGSDFFFPYVVPRNIFFRVVVEVGVAALVLALCYGRKTLDLHSEPILWSLVAFIAAASLSALFSPAPTHSFFGDFERMGGVWAWLHLVVFFLLLRTLRDEDWNGVLNAALAVGSFVSLTTIAQHTALAFGAQLPAVFVGGGASTLGNTGLLAAYLLMNVALAGYLASTSVRYRVLYLAAGGLNLLAMVFAENRSTVIGLVVGAIAGGLIFASVAKASRRKWIVLAAAGALAAVVVGVSAGVRAFPTSSMTRHVPTVLQRLALTNPAGADESRTMQWRAAIDGFKDRPLLGYGPENHKLVWSAHFDPRIYAIDTDIYDRTHNQFLEMLATTGLVGTVAFLGIWFAIALTLVRAYRVGRLSAPALAILAGLQVAYAIYLFFWFVDLNSTMLWILIAALIASRGTVGSVVLEVRGHDAEAATARPVLALASVIVLIAALYSEAWTPLRANRALARIDSPRGNVAQTLSEIELLSNSSARQGAHTPIMMAQFIGSLRPRLEEMRASSDERRMLDSAFVEALATFAREIHRDTLNDRLYLHEGGLLLEASHFYQSSIYEQLAVDAFHKAIELSPRRIEQRLALAGLYTGNQDYERALVVLNDAVKIDPFLGEPRYRLAEAFIGAGHGDSALSMLQTSLRLGYVGAPELYLTMGKRLEFSGRSATAAKLYSDYLEAKYTESVWDRSEPIDRPVPTADIAVAAHLPLLYMRASESELAIKTAAALSAFDPSRDKLVDRFVSDVGAQRRGNWVAKNSLLPCATTLNARSRDAVAFGACGVFRRKL
ncbi:MAG TPA: O-antigen ligase family protein [Gemmatimonadaceae bacterium]|nr:O-antigen ligase family protein [Gemmatimonadaceae bacterium]